MQNTDNESQSAPYVAPPEPFPVFGSSLSYAVLSPQGFQNTGASTVYGDIGVSSSGPTTGLDSITRTGGVNHFGDALASAAQTDAASAYQNIVNAQCEHDLSGQDLSGMALTPGTYCFSGDAILNGLLTLDAGGSNHANFTFQIAGNLITQADAGIQLLNHGETCNVFWQVAGAVSFATGTNFIGGIITTGNATFDQNSELNGKILSLNGMVSINETQIYNNFCPWW